MLTFQMLLNAGGFSLNDVRLLRHAIGQSTRGMAPYVAWRDHPERFEQYQSTQLVKDRKYFSAPYWASFVSTPAKETLFVGVYQASLMDMAIDAFHCPLTKRPIEIGTFDRYATRKLDDFAAYEGKLLIDWGAGTRSWGQYAERKDKPIIELSRSESDPPFPGYSRFMAQLSEIETLPRSWQAILSSVRGVYLLTCPKSKEQYVGGAYASGGFLSRWRQHAASQGDAVAFRRRDPEDYRVSILEVAGSLMTDDDIGQMEERWKEKLQSRLMGLNRN